MSGYRSTQMKRLTTTTAEREAVDNYHSFLDSAKLEKQKKKALADRRRFGLGFRRLRRNSPVGK